MKFKTLGLCALLIALLGCSSAQSLTEVGDLRVQVEGLRAELEDLKWQIDGHKGLGDGVDELQAEVYGSGGLIEELTEGQEELNEKLGDIREAIGLSRTTYSECLRRSSDTSVCSLYDF